MDAAEVAAFLSENPNVQYVDCVFVDLCGNVRGKRIASAELEAVFRSGLAVPTSIYFLDARGDVAERALAGAGATGTAWPVAGSLTCVSWAQRPHGQVLMSLTDAKGVPYFGEPRNVLKRVIRRFEEFDVVPLAFGHYRQRVWVAPTNALRLQSLEGFVPFDQRLAEPDVELEPATLASAVVFLARCEHIG